MGNAYRSVLASGGAATPLTPSNSSPVTMTAGETYTPTKNGKAVESITDVTPSNSSPATLSTNTIYKPTTNGKAVASVTDLSSSWLQTLSANTVYKNGSSAQYAINSYSSSSKSPSSSGTYFSSGWNYMNSSGYAYSSQPSSSDEFKAYKGYKRTLIYRGDANDGKWAGPLWKISSLTSDMTITVTGKLSTHKLGSTGAFTVDSSFTASNWKVLGAFNINSTTWSIPVSTMLAKWTSAQLNANTYIGLAIGNYTTNGAVYEITIS